MFKFKVKYTQDDYMDYYKYTMIKRKLIRNIVIAVLFFTIAIYWWIDKSEATQKNALPIMCVVFGILLPCLNFLFIPMIKKQLKGKAEQINNTDLTVTFTEDEIIYENNSIIPEAKNEEVAEPVAETTEEPVVDETMEEAKAETVKEEAEGEVENTKEPEVTEMTEEVTEAAEDTEEPQDERVFKLNYANIFEARDTGKLLLLFLDKQTAIILPKTSIVEGTCEAFVDFLKTKIETKRFKIK